MFYNGKNILIKINEQNILATEANLSYEAQITPYFEIGQQYTDTVVPENIMQGSFTVNYIFTGQDPIKNLLHSETPVKFDFGGLIQNSGYIKSFSCKFSPHETIKCSTEIIFFDSPTGEFKPISDDLSIISTPVHVNQISISNFNNQNLTGSYLNATYSYAADIRSEIHVGQSYPERAVFGIKETNLSIICDNLNPLLNISGSKVGVVLGVSNFGTSLITQGYAVTGFLVKKNFQTSVEDFLKNEITIKQYNVLEEAEIHNFLPTSGRFRDRVNISGKNFDYVAQVFFGEYQADSFVINNSTSISAVVPRMRNITNQQIRMLTLA